MEESKNLDSLINNFSYEMVQEMIKDENNKERFLNIIEKALGVLANNGVYAYYVYCKSLVKKENRDNLEQDQIFKTYVANVVKKFQGYVKPNFTGNYDVFFSNLSEDIHDLLFFKDMLEQILTYARYHAKPYGGNKNE